jgi:hypothetical protein
VEDPEAVLNYDIDTPQENTGWSGTASGTSSMIMFNRVAPANLHMAPLHIIAEFAGRARVHVQYCFPTLVTATTLSQGSMPMLTAMIAIILML